MSLTQTIDALLAFVSDGQPIRPGSERQNRFDALDLAVWVEACRLGHEGKLPTNSTKRESLGNTNQPGNFNMIDGFCPVDLGEWRSRLLALVALADAGAAPPKQTRAKPATVNERMAAMLQEDPLRFGWPATKWATALEVTAAAVKQTPTWTKTIRAARALQAPDRAEAALRRARR